MNFLLKVGVCFVFAALLSSDCRAQSGVVKADNQPIPGATIKATQGERVLLTVTDDSGAFHIDKMTPGTWIVEADMFGFDHFRKEVQVGPTAQKIDITMQLRAPRTARGGRGGANADDTGATEFTAGGAGPVEAPPVPDVASDASNQSFNLQGSISQGAGTTGADFRGGDFGPGGGFGPGGPGGPGGDNPGGPGGRAARGAGAAGGGAGGGGPRGGGGGFGGGGGGRGGGGPGRGGRGGAPRDRNGNPAFIGNRQRGQQNRITGSLFYTFGNSVLNARPFSVNGIEAPKAAYAQNRFGFSAGGPMYVPKLFNFPKVFWFINYTGNLVRNGVDQAFSEPTLAMRGGDFSSLSTVIYNPTTHQPFQTNNVIPQAMISPIAQGLLKYLPTPNQAISGTNQDFRLITANPNNAQNLNTRVNTTLTPRDTLAATFNFQERDTDTLQVFGCCDSVQGYGTNANLNWRHRFGTRSFNAVTLQFNRNTNLTVPFFANTSNVSAALGIQGVSNDPRNFGPPALSFTNFSTLSDGNDTHSAVWSYGVNDQFQWRKGKHNWSFGAGWTHFLNNTITDANGRGQFYFTGLSTAGYTPAGLPIPKTGYDFADFLLGQPEEAKIRYGDSATYFRSNGYNAFVQDDWRVKAGLSFNLGLRYEYFTPWHEQYGHAANLDIAPGFSAVAPVLPGQAGPLSGLTYPNALVQSDKNNFSPRVSVAWKPNPKKSLTIRSSYGWYYNPSQYNRLEPMLAAEPPFALVNDVTTSLGAPLVVQSAFLQTAGKSVTNSYAVAENYLNSYAQTWNLLVQNDLPGRMVIEVSYLGTKGTRLDILQAPNQAALGSALTGEQRLPIANAGQFQFDDPVGNSIYQAGQFRLTRRFVKGVSWNLFYTLSKSIDDLALAQNFYDQAAERALSTNDHRHVVTANWVLASPVDATRGFLSHPAWLAKGLKDWTLSGSMTAQTGAPLTPTVTGNINGTSSPAPLRADVTGVPLYSGTGYFNTAAFAIPAAGTFGTAGRDIIEGPGSFVMNFSLSRSINLKSEQRRLEFRVDSNNTLNHVNPTGLITVVNSTQYGLITNASGMRQISATLRLRF